MSATKADLREQYDQARKVLQTIYNTVRAVQPGDWEAAFKALERIEVLCERALRPMDPDPDADGGATND